MKEPVGTIGSPTPQIIDQLIGTHRFQLLSWLAVLQPAVQTVQFDPLNPFARKLQDYLDRILSYCHERCTLTCWKDQPQDQCDQTKGYSFRQDGEFFLKVHAAVPADG